MIYINVHFWASCFRCGCVIPGSQEFCRRCSIALGVDPDEALRDQRQGGKESK